MKRTFTTKLKSEEVEIDGKVFAIREMSGSGRSAYMEEMSKDMKEVDVGGGKKERRPSKFIDVDLLILSVTVFDAEGKLVPRSTIEQWPAALVTELSKIANNLNATDEKSVEEVKNDSGASA